MATCYVAFDGDNVGARLSLLIEEGQDEAISSYANGVAQEMASTAELARSQFSAKVLMCSGDSLLFRMDSRDVNHFLSLFGARAEKWCTYSVGVGRTVQEAHSCLSHAKLAGKDRVVWWTVSASEVRLAKIKWVAGHPLLYFANWIKHL